jgi:aconitate decarboxylase
VFGAPPTAATAKLCDLSAAQTEDAIGIACTQAGGLMAAQYEGSVKRMQHAFAARNGLPGALLARGKYGGIKKVFERPYGGFLAMFSLGSKYEPRYKVEEVVKGLGELWHTTELIRVKLHACVGGCHGLIEVLARMQEKEKGRLARENLGKVKEIRIGLFNPIFHHDG